MKILAVDVGGTEIKYGLVDEDNDISEEAYIPTPLDSLDDFLDTIYSIYCKFDNEVEGIAMSVPGFVDSKNGITVSGGALLYNINQPIGKLLEKKCGCKVHIENDGKAAAMAELGYGALRGCQNAAVFIIGTGVGGGIIIDGKLVKGKNFTAGELSFVTSDLHNKDNEDEKHGSMVNYCSTPALINNYKKLSGEKEDIDGRELFKRYYNGDKCAKEALEQFCEYTAIQILNLGVILNVEKVAIGGGISRQPIVLDLIRKKIIECSANSFITRVCGSNPMIPEVVNCKYSSSANLVGAVYSYLNNC